MNKHLGYSWPILGELNLNDIPHKFRRSQLLSISFKLPFFISARANSTFESERAKLLAEVQELSCSKRHLEDVVKTLTDSERHKTHTIKTLEERLKSDVDKFKKDADIEAKRLVRSIHEF